jgi:hypothetical protein
MGPTAVVSCGIKGTCGRAPPLQPFSASHHLCSKLRQDCSHGCRWHLPGRPRDKHRPFMEGEIATLMPACRATVSFYSVRRTSWPIRSLIIYSHSLHRVDTRFCPAPFNFLDIHMPYLTNYPISTQHLNLPCPVYQSPYMTRHFSHDPL